MSTEAHELYSLLVPLRDERLLVPRMCVAEVIAFAELKPPEHAGAPEWILGTVDWNGHSLPVVSFDESVGDIDSKRNRLRIVVMHSITGRVKTGHYGILTQGFPQLVRVNPNVLSLDTDRPVPNRLPVLCRVRMINEYPLIPDVEKLEALLGEAIERAT